MTKEMTSAEKCRKTKLSKKSVEELIDIIVRKDNVERRKDKLITYLKTNIVGLEKKVNVLNSSISNIETEFTNVKQDNIHLTNYNYKSKELIIKLRETIKVSNDTINHYEKQLMKALVADIKCFAIGIILGSIVTFIIAKLIY